MKISEFKVMHSNAGYYIGTSYFDEECGCDLPYSRDSQYYSTYDQAVEALAYHLAMWSQDTQNKD